MNDILERLGRFDEDSLFEKMNKEGRVITYDWSKYDTLNVVFKPKNMTPEELEEGMWKVGKICNSFSNCIKRTLKSFKLGFYPAVFTLQSNFYQMEFYRNKGLGI